MSSKLGESRFGQARRGMREVGAVMAEYGLKHDLAGARDHFKDKEDDLNVTKGKPDQEGTSESAVAENTNLRLAFTS